MPRQRAICCFTPWGVCVEVKTVSFWGPSSQCASTARGSMDAGARRWFTRRSETLPSAAANSRSVSAWGKESRVADVVCHMGVDLRRVRLHGLLEIHHGGAGIDLHLHVEGAIPGLVSIRGDHHGDGLAHVAHDTVRQQRMVGVLHVRNHDGDGRAPDLPAQVVVGEDRDDAGPRQRARGIDLDDATGRMIAPYEGGVEHAVELQVIGIGGETADQAGILAALDAFSDVDRLHRRAPARRHDGFPSRSRRAACCTFLPYCLPYFLQIQNFYMQRSFTACDKCIDILRQGNDLFRTPGDLLYKTFPLFPGHILVFLLKDLCKTMDCHCRVLEIM